MVWYPHFPLHPFVAWQQRLGLRSLNCEVLNSAIVQLAIFGIRLRCSPVSSGISKAQAGFWEYITTYLILFSCKRTKSLVVVCWPGACDDSFFGELKTNALNRRFLLLTSLRRDSFGVVLSFGMPVCIKAPRACTIGFLPLVVVFSDSFRFLWLTLTSWKHFAVFLRIDLPFSWYLFFPFACGLSLH